MFLNFELNLNISSFLSTLILLEVVRLLGAYLYVLLIFCCFCEVAELIVALFWIVMNVWLMIKLACYLIVISTDFGDSFVVPWVWFKFSKFD